MALCYGLARTLSAEVMTNPATRSGCGDAPKLVEKSPKTDAEKRRCLPTVALGGLECTLNRFALHSFYLASKIERTAHAAVLGG
jgi:hypothetical protein